MTRPSSHGAQRLRIMTARETSFDVTEWSPSQSPAQGAVVGVAVRCVAVRVGVCVIVGVRVMVGVKVGVGVAVGGLVAVRV